MKTIAFLSALAGLFCHLHAETPDAPRSLAEAVLEAQAPPLHPLEQQTVYFSVTSKVREGKTGMGRIDLRYPELSEVEFRVDNLPDKIIDPPSRVKLPPGVTQRYFEFKVRDDKQVNLTRNTSLSLWLGDYQIASVPLQVLDNEKAPAMTLRIPKRLSEGAAKSTGRISLDRPADVDLRVALSQDIGHLVKCPAQVVIRAGQTSREFKIGAIDDAKINGNTPVVLTARVPGLANASAFTRVIDNEKLDLHLKIPAEVVEGTPVRASVELPGTLPHGVTITLRNSHPSRLSMPEAVSILPGRSSASFMLTAIDTMAGESSVQVSIHASAPGLSPDDAVTLVREIAGVGRSRTIPLATNDLVWDSQRGRIYASVPSSAGAPYGNQVVAIDPDTLQVTASLAVNQEPGQLALTSGGEFLYVARNGNGTISKIDPSTFTESQVFSIGTDPSYGTLYAEDICTVAGQPDLLVVSQYRKHVSPRHNGVAVYDHGVARSAKTQDHTGSNVIEPSADPTIFFGYNTETTEYGFRRIQLSAAGLTQLDVNTSLVDGFDVDIRSDGDLVVSSSGIAIDGAHMKRAGTFPVSGYDCLVCPDHATNRVYIMEPDGSWGGSFSRIVAYDPSTFTPIHEIPLAETATSPASLIRWGNSGLAYRTPAAIVIMTNGQLIPGDPPADLAVTVQATPNPATVGNKLTYTVQVTNAGPNAAKNIVLNAALSTRQTVSSTSASHGSPVVSGLNVSLSLASLASGASETLTLVTTPQSAGSLTCNAGASSNAIDPDNANNVGFKLVSVGFQSAANKVNELNLTANNVVSDPKRELLWASIPDTESAPLGKSVVSIDPLTGLVSDPLPLNANPCPGAMALSGNGRYLYVGLTDAPEVQRIDLDSADHSAVRIPLGLSQWRDANYAQDIEVLDGDGTSFIFSSADDHAAAIIDGTVMRADRTSIYSVDSLARTGTSGVFIGYNNESSGFDLSRLSATATGVSTLLKYSNVVSGYSTVITGDGDLVLSSNGRLIDSRTLTLIADLAMTGCPCVDSANQRAYMVSGNTLFACNANNGNPAGSLTLRTGSSGNWARQCIRWGSDGFAVLGNDGKIAIARWSLAVPAAPALASAAVSSAADPAPDSDGDGLTDAIEFFFGTSPTAFTAQPVKLTRLPTAGDATLHLTFPRRAGITPPSYIYQTSRDLSHWTPSGNITETVLSTRTTDGIEVETIDAAIRVPQADATFVRIVWQP